MSVPFLVLVLYFSQQFLQVDCISCYVCQSVVTRACGSLFMLNKNSEKYLARCPTSCFTFVAAKGDFQAVSRGCLPEIKTPPRCLWDNDGDIHGSMCVCNSDFCNATSALRASSFLHGSVALMLLIFVTCEVF